MEDKIKKELVGKEIKCKNCGRTFIWTEGEQEYYKSMEFPEPQRCWRCRQIKKNRNNKINE